MSAPMMLTPRATWENPPTQLSEAQIRELLKHDLCFRVVRGGVLYDVGMNEAHVCAWVADADEDALAVKRFGDINPFTGRPYPENAAHIAAWLTEVCDADA